MPFYSRRRFRLRLWIKIPAPVKLCRTWRKFMGFFLTPESNCLPNLKRNEPYWRKLSTPAASNHPPEKRNFNASIFVSNKFMLKFHWKSVFTFLSATCDDIGWSSTKDNSSFPDPDFIWILFTFSLSLFISRLGSNTWLALIHFRFSVLVIHKCMSVNRFLSTCISNQQENAQHLIQRDIPTPSNSRSRPEFDLACSFLSQRYSATMFTSSTDFLLINTVTSTNR